jgi:hypothetical protein
LQLFRFRSHRKPRARTLELPNAGAYTHHITQSQQGAQGLFLQAMGKTESRKNRKNEGKTAIAGWTAG